jgi:hypothetical protein
MSFTSSIAEQKAMTEAQAERISALEAGHDRIDVKPRRSAYCHPWRFAPSWALQLLPPARYWG